MSYRISTVADMTGIPRNTLIAWERRYGLLNPDRHNNGYRFYSDEEVGILLRIKNALNAGLKISEAVHLVRRGRGADVTHPPRESPTEETPNAAIFGGAPYVHYRAQLIELLLAYRGDDAKALLAQLVNVPYSIRLHQVFFPVLSEIGHLWEQGEASVAQEHFASGIIRGYLASIFVSTSHPPLAAPHAACTTLPHDEHEIAALALSIQLSQTGYRVSYLGPKLPFDALEGFVVKQAPALLCISCLTNPYPNQFDEYLRSIARFVPMGVRVVVGGQLLRSLALPTNTGIEFYPNWSDFLA